jgi:sirohydrochlorin ferrochelatase
MLLTRRASILALAGAGVLSAASCAGLPESTEHSGHTGPDLASPDLASDVGVLIMAHGGGPAWNGDVEAMLKSVGAEHPMELAFGMAEAASLQNSVAKLEARGAKRIVVARLFISGESFYERTEQILGLAPGAEPKPAEHAAHGDAAHGDHGDQGAAAGHSMDMALWRIDTKASFAISKQGLAEAPEMGAVLVERVRGLSKAPAKESVLVLAHGPGDDAENERWLRMIDQRAEAVRRFAPFKRVQTETLREDWPEKRVVSEARIRAFVEAASADGGRAIVLSYRVSGFGPYADVLKGLDYVPDTRGLLPSTEVERWVRRQVTELAAGPFRTPQHVHGAG